MILRVERRGDEFIIPIPLEGLEAMGLKEGDEVIVQPLDGGYQEQVNTFLKTEPLHRDTYRKLAE
jgi:antitoxin component of MazEF toxin-antitoxin module